MTSKHTSQAGPRPDLDAIDPPPMTKPGECWLCGRPCAANLECKACVGLIAECMETDDGFECFVVRSGEPFIYEPKLRTKHVLTGRSAAHTSQPDSRQGYPRATPSGPAWETATLERNWLVYRLVPRPGKKPAKHPAHPQTGSAPISLYDAACLTFAEALDALDPLGAAFGLGYLPRPGSTLIGLDFDECLMPWDDGPDPWVVHMLSWGVDTLWAERSPSGFGVRVVAMRTSEEYTPATDREANGCGYFAGGGRFFTVTFDLLPGREPCPRPCRLVAKYMLARISGDMSEPSPAEDADESHWFNRLTGRRQDEEVERMLAHLTDPKFGDYELWLRISFAVYRATDSRGYEIWDRWCQRLPGYHAERNAKKWDRGLYEPGRGPAVTVGTLIMHARQHGYQPPPDVWSPSSPFADIRGRIYSPEELSELNARFLRGLAKRGHVQ